MLSEKRLLEEIETLLNAKGRNYRQLLKLASKLAKHDHASQGFTVDAKTLLQLGRDSIKDHTTALVELVKNSYDADATKVDVEIISNSEGGYIRIADNGFGMTKDQLSNNWLRIGFSGKRTQKLSEKGRRKTGEKGIGRISADRLGSKLNLKTKTVDDGIIGAEVNWDEFDVEGKEIFEIDIKVDNPKTIHIPIQADNNQTSGTEIIISGLRQAWTKENLDGLSYELAALTSPFKRTIDFDVRLRTNIDGVHYDTEKIDFLKVAEIEVELVWDGEETILLTKKNKGRRRTNRNNRNKPILCKKSISIRAAIPYMWTTFCKIVLLFEGTINNSDERVYLEATKSLS